MLRSQDWVENNWVYTVRRRKVKRMSAAGGTCYEDSSMDLMHMRRTTVGFFLFCFLLPQLAGARTFYVDCSIGSDDSEGSSAAAAWRTLTKVSGMRFSAGDSILLARGTRCPGQLWPKGSGEEDRPIHVGAYGVGPLPVIDAGNFESAIKLFDQHHWEIENLETVGGTPYGVFVSGTHGDLRHFVLRNLVVHDVTGEAKTKVSGLVTITAPGPAYLQDILIDGVTAYNTAQWGGIVVNGDWLAGRVRNVVIRNSIVHHVYGDGMVLWAVEDGLIEKSAAWLTGLQPVENIGTPNGIWTWMCRRCTVRLTEGFFIDSPGVDGGVFDIDWGNDHNLVEYNYGHDAQGYCAAIFAAEKLTTQDSVIRGNLCIDNGRSPKLALRQGDMYISTWDGGRLDGVRIENNTFHWNPPLDAPAIQMDHADFAGANSNILAGNTIWTAVSHALHVSDAIHCERNTVARAGAPPAAAPCSGPRRFRLVLTGADRGQLVFLQTALAQYPSWLEAELVLPGAAANLVYDWNLGSVRLLQGSGEPGLKLLSPEGQVMAQWSGFAPPAELGLALRRALGTPTPFAAGGLP
jgi:hypothetical protein